MKIVKIWPCRNTEIRISVNEKMEKDFLHCLACEKEEEIPICEKCDWLGIEFGCEGFCEHYKEKIAKQLEEKSND